MEMEMELKRYFQVAQQNKSGKNDGPEDNPTAWLMVGDTPTQLVNWLNESDGKTHREKVWFRVLNREELGTWSHLREVITLRKELLDANKVINTLRKELKIERGGKS
jgi:hypothetical protein